MTDIDLGKMRVIADALTPILSEVLGEFHKTVLAFEKVSKTGKREDLKAAMDALKEVIATGRPSDSLKIIGKIHTTCASLGTPLAELQKPSSGPH